MALQALAPYYLDAGEFNRLGTAHSHEDLQSAVKKALDFLSTSQNSTGGYGSSESSAQVIVALAALKKDAGSFAKGSISVLADLLGYRKTDGGFSHTSDGPIDQMSTEQAAYALVAYDRYKNNKKPLYDMSDVFDGPTDGTDTDHTIHASADAGGTISPVGDVTVPDGAKQSFTVTPNEGYQIEDILVDGKSVWAGGATVAQKLEPPEYQLPTVPVEDVEPEAAPTASMWVRTSSSASERHLHRAWIHWRYDLRCLRRSAGAGRGNQNGSASVRRRVADGRDEPLAGVPDLRRQK